MSMDIADLMKKYGARTYLSGLRRRYLQGHYTWIRFALNAGAAYCADNKPKRARALLDTLEPHMLDQVQLEAYRRIRLRVASCAAAGGHDCSINIIAKNESAHIAAALDSVDAVADEIVICDTGSDDDTVAKARLYGAVIVLEKWRDDFSLARNAAIEVSTCAWILWMDADDRLEDDCATELISLVRSSEPRGIALRVSNQMAGSPPVDFIQVRLFPRRSDIRFERSIHEQIMFSLHRAHIPCSRCDSVRIRHIGYTNPQVYAQKLRRNRALITRELNKNPGDPSLTLALADTCLGLGETEKALQAYRRICADSSAFELTTDIFVQAHVNIALLELKRNNHREAKRYLYRSLYLDPSRIEASYYLARLLLKEGEDKKAADFLVRAAGTIPPVRMTAVNNTMVRLQALYYLAELLLKWGHYQEAEGLLKAALVQYPLVPQFYSQIGKSLLARKRLKEAAAFFIQSINLCPRDNDEAYAGMAEIYTAIGKTSATQAFLKKNYIQQQRRGYALLI